MQRPTWSRLLLASTTIVGSHSAASSFHRPKPIATQLSRRIHVRGGSSNEYFGQNDQYSPYPITDSYDAPPVNGGGGDPFPQQTVQDRVEQWRYEQRQQQLAREQQANTYPQQPVSPRDEQGRLKLLTSVGKGSRAVIFFLLMWRNIHLYEVADAFFKNSRFMRLVTVVPLTFLFIANLAGVVSSLTSPSHSAKKRLKAILNLDKLLEVLLICYYLLRLTILPSKYQARELYVSGLLHSVVFILQCQAFTKLSWDETIATAHGAAPPVMPSGRMQAAPANDGPFYQRHDGGPW